MKSGNVYYASVPIQVEKDEDRVVDQVYDKYGSDLSAFFSDVQRQLQLERSEGTTEGQHKQHE